MKQSLVDRLDANKEAALDFLRKGQDCDYRDLVKYLVSLDEEMDPERITEIDHGNYQGTLLYVIGAEGYQPDRFWYVKVGYGSCSGCDELEAVQGYGDEIEDLEGYYKLLHDIAAGFREMNTGDKVA